MGFIRREKYRETQKIQRLMRQSVWEAENGRFRNRENTETGEIQRESEIQRWRRLRRYRDREAAETEEIQRQRRYRYSVNSETKEIQRQRRCRDIF